MGNINNTHIEYWTKSGYKISYLFWDLKGKNRFPQQPSDLQISFIFNKCLEEIEISSYQLKAIQQFTPKYKYRFVVLHKRKVQEATKEHQIKKLSRDSFQINFFQQARGLQSKKKTEQVEKLLMKVQLNESSIKSTLIDLEKFISDTQFMKKCRHAHNEFIELRGIERILSHLQTSNRMNEKGTKTSFSSQIQLLKFLRIFSDKFSKEIYSYLPAIRSYAGTIIQSYHPINTQIIAYSLSLLSDFAWRVQPQKQEDSLIQILQKHKIQNKLQSFLSPFIESIIDSDSIVNVYHNVKFINQLMASVVGKKDKDLLQQNLIKTKYTMVLQNVKMKLQTMHYSIEKTTFISVYQKIFKHSLAKQGLLKQQPNIDIIIEENYRNSVLANNNRNSLQAMHQQAIATLIQVESQIVSQDYIQDGQLNQLVTYLNDNDRRQFNKLIFDTLTEMQKFYKLQFYLQTTFLENQQTSIDPDYQKAKELIDTRIIQHNVQTYFNKIKLECTQNKTIDILYNSLQKIQTFNHQQWKQLQKWLFQGNQQQIKLLKENQQLKNDLEEKKNKIKNLIKQNNELKTKNQQANNLERKNSQNINNHQSNILKPPPSLEESLKMNSQNNTSSTGSPMIPSLPPLPIELPSIPVFNLGLSMKQKTKRQPPKPLKACNYTTITYEKIKNSVFEQIDETKVGIDENQLVQLFSKNAQSEIKFKRASSIQTIVSNLNTSRLTLPGSMKQTVQLLRSDRAKNIQIVLAKLKIPKGEFKKALIQCNGGKYLSQSTLQAILKILPTEEQQQLINSFQGNNIDLGVSERFFKQLIEVPEYASRIKAILYSHISQELNHQIETKIDQLSKGFVSLRQNSRLKCVIQNCLTIGNYLNGQSVKGGAWGFRLETIQRLQEVKSADGKMNGALYLIKQLWKHFEYPLFDRKQIQLYQYLAKMPLLQVKHQIDQLQSFVNTIDKACKSKDETNLKDQIVTFCSNFQQKASQKLIQYKSQFEELKDAFGKCARYYCEDQKSLASDQFGKKMYQCILFVSNTQKIYKVINEKNLKSLKNKAVENNISYRQSVNPQKLRESMINIRDQNEQNDIKDESLSKTTALILQVGNNNSQRLSLKRKESGRTSIINESQIIIPINHSQRASHRLSSIFEVHKPTKPLQQLSQQEIQTELKAIQKQSVNRAMEDVFRRRTQKFQNINARFSKVSNLGETENKVDIQARISFLKNVGGNERNTIINEVK